MASAVVKALVAARQKCLTEDEAYWDPKPDFTRPVSARNEAAALSWLLDHQAVVCRGGPADAAELQALCAGYCTSLGAVAAPEQRDVEAGKGGSGASSSGRSFEEASSEATLQRWCTQRGVRGAASPALFGGSARGAGPGAGAAGGPAPLRGLRADSAVSPGDVVLHVPADLLISYETAKESDLGKVLAALPLALGDDSIALVWTCVERHEPEAPHAPFWAALPARFTTLLSAPESDLALLKGTPLYQEATQARQHLRDAFEASSLAFRSLMGAYPDYFKAEWFSWESYIWAAELWYSYGIQVQFASGDIRTCMAPYLGLMNHHPLPHVVHFSKVDEQTGCLRVRAFRPCAAGQQLFLSYGPYPNGKLLLFYGFALPDNPADEVAVALQVPPGPAATDRRALLTAAGIPLEHRLRAGGRLPQPLLACARLLGAPPAQLKQLRALSLAELKAQLAKPVGAEEDRVALQLLEAAVDALWLPAVGCAKRLREGGGETAATAAPPLAGAAAVVIAGATAADASDDVSSGTLGHFAGVYAQGVAQILAESLRAVRAAQGSENAST